MYKVTGVVDKIETLAYMREVVEEYRDPLTDEINNTLLAEDACQHFDGYGPAPYYDIPDR